MGYGKIGVKVKLNGTKKVFVALYRYPNSNIPSFSYLFEKTLCLLNKNKLFYYIL